MPVKLPRPFPRCGPSAFRLPATAPATSIASYRPRWAGPATQKGNKRKRTAESILAWRGIFGVFLVEAPICSDRNATRCEPRTALASSSQAAAIQRPDSPSVLFAPPTERNLVLLLEEGDRRVRPRSRSGSGLRVRRDRRIGGSSPRNADRHSPGREPVRAGAQSPQHVSDVGPLLVGQGFHAPKSSCRRTTPFTCRGGRCNVDHEKPNAAATAAVRCNGWILLTASGGTGRTCRQVQRDHRLPRSHVDLSASCFFAGRPLSPQPHHGVPRPSRPTRRGWCGK